MEKDLKNKEYKTTQKEFQLFKKEFLYWQKTLGQMQYEIHFELGGTFNDAAASIEPDCRYKIATARLATTLNTNYNNIRAFAKHEAIHLFLEQLTYVARSRFVTEEEITRTDEGMVRVLERLLWKHH